MTLSSLQAQALTSLSAQRLGLKDRGLLREGYWADVVLFDPNRIADRATFAIPKQYPDGINYVLVKGHVVVDRGNHYGRAAGRRAPRARIQRTTVAKEA